MGMDVSGLDPTINKSRKDFPMLTKWEDKTWPEREEDKNWDKEKEQYWKEDNEWNKANPGIYFRNNCWWWRPLWDFCAYHCPDLISDDIHNGGHYNDGKGLNADSAAKLGVQLLSLIEDGTVAAHQKEVELDQEDKEYKYPFDVENVKAFADFCIQSGGFEIW